MVLKSEGNLMISLKTAGKLVLAAGAAAIWGLGLSDQLDDPMQTAKYVGISLLMVATAFV